MNTVRPEAITLNEEIKLFHPAADQPREYGCIGSMRGDFGHGDSFYFDWFPNANEHLNDTSFKPILAAVIDSLRKPGEILHSRRAMRNYCATRKECRIPGLHNGSDWGFRIITQDYLFYIHCIPVEGDYNFYVCCYHKDMLLDQLSRARGLPRYCYAYLPTTGEEVRIDFPETGYCPYRHLRSDRQVREINREIGVTPAQAEAMLAGSMFGWNVPAADPKNYDQHGRLRGNHTNQTGGADS